MVRAIAQIPWARKIEIPEAICLAVGKLYGYMVLTENRGAFMARQILPDYHSVRIYRSIDILREAMLRHVINVSTREDILAELEIFNRDTGHIFRNEDIKELVGRVMDEISRRNKKEVGENRKGGRKDTVKDGRLGVHK